MSRQPHLVVTIEGVLTNDPLRHFWELIEAASGVDSQDIQERFSDELGEALFSGKVPEEAFWQWLRSSYQLDDQSYWHQLLLERRYPLLGMHLLPRLATQSRITLLCGQRHEWFEGLIKAEDAAYAASRVIYSSKVGLTKRDPELYQKLRVDGRDNLLLDNSRHALQLAEAHGFSAFPADQEMRWVDTLVGQLDRLNKTGRKGWRGLLSPKY